MMFSIEGPAKNRLTRDLGSQPARPGLSARVKPQSIQAAPIDARAVERSEAHQAPGTAKHSPTSSWTLSQAQAAGAALIARPMEHESASNAHVNVRRRKGARRTLPTRARAESRAASQP